MKKNCKSLKLFALILSILLVLPLDIVSAMEAARTTEIKHESPDKYFPGFRINLDAEITDNLGIMVARCYFKTKKQENFVFVNMTKKAANNYLATLPAPWVNSEYIEYVFVVVNNDKKVVRSEVFTIEEEDTKAAMIWEGTGKVKEIQLDLVQEALEDYEAIYKQLRDEVKDKLTINQKGLDQGKLNISTELDRKTEKLTDFYDRNVVISEVPDYLKYGLLAEGLYTDEQRDKAGGLLAVQESTGATSAGSIKADDDLPWGWIALGAAAVGGAIASSSSSSSGGGAVAGRLASFTAPNPQSPPYSIEVIAHNAVPVPATMTYDGSSIGDGSYLTGTEVFPIPGVGGVVRLTLTSDVSGGALEFHFNSGGGRQPGPGIPFIINGTAGNYIELHTR